MRKHLLFVFLLLTALPVWSGLATPSLAETGHPLTARWEFFSLSPAERSTSGLDAKVLAVLFVTPSQGWYTYSDRPGSVGLPTRLTAELEGEGPLAVLYPDGERKPDPGDPTQSVETYHGTTPLFVPLPAEARAPFRLAARLDLLLCASDKCLPVHLSLPAVSKAADLSPAGQQPWWPRLLAASERFQARAETPTPAARAAQDSGETWHLTPSYFQSASEVATLLPAVLLGLLAGMILNFMPCVLPVVSLKLTALLSGASGGDEHHRQRLFREHNLFFALGVLLYFLFLSVLLGLTGLAWGQIFQQPVVALALAALIFALALSLLGLFSLPMLNLMFRESTHPRSQALITGVLTTLLATPCSGPFLGGVLGWALLQPPLVIGAVFLAIGLGMASPYLAMVVSPGFVRFLPKPGPWIAYVEKGVAFFLLGTCIYLLNILPTDHLVPALVLLWVTTLAAWLLGRATRAERRAGTWGLRVLALALFAAVFVWAVQPRPRTAWAEFEAATFRAQLGQTNILVDFTADWCPTCKVLEQTVLTPARLASWKEEYGLTLVRVDLSRSNPEGERLLAALGSKSIPLLAVFGAKAPDRPLVLRDLFTGGQVGQALSQALNP